jgi:hypothetical protein
MQVAPKKAPGGIRYLTFTGIPARPGAAENTRERVAAGHKYSRELYSAAKDNIRAFRELMQSSSSEETINLISMTSEDTLQGVHSGFLNTQIIESARRAVYKLFQAVASDDDFKGAMDYIVDRYIAFNSQRDPRKEFTVSFGKDGQFVIKNRKAYDQLPDYAKRLVLGTLLMREARGLTELQTTGASNAQPWDSVLVNDRNLRGQDGNYDGCYKKLEELTDWGFLSFADNFARSIAYEHDPIAGLFAESSRRIVGEDGRAVLEVV